jgi:hypothetical protein
MNRMAPDLLYLRFNHFAGSLVLEYERNIQLKKVLFISRSRADFIAVIENKRQWYACLACQSRESWNPGTVGAEANPALQSRAQSRFITSWRSGPERMEPGILSSISASFRQNFLETL